MASATAPIRVLMVAPNSGRNLSNLLSGISFFGFWLRRRRIFGSAECGWRNEHVHVTATLANRALSHSIPGLQVEEVEQRRGELNFVLPKNAMPTNVTTELSPLYLNGAELVWSSDWRHCLRCSGCSKCLTVLLSDRPRCHSAPPSAQSIASTVRPSLIHGPLQRFVRRYSLPLRGKEPTSQNA
jgi:hypothetical protein